MQKMSDTGPRGEWDGVLYYISELEHLEINFLPSHLERYNPFFNILSVIVP
jgi:hypothetical protein